ncbi:MAG: kelch repeat-containing protein [Opitutaceae bacterium]
MKFIDKTSRYLALLFCVGFGSAAMASSLVWTSGPDLPSPRAEAAAVIGPGSTVLLMGGVSPSGATVVPKLANEAATWTTAHDLGNARFGLGAVSFSSSGILVFGGGDGGNEPTDEALLYDYYLGDSQDAEKMSEVREHFAFAVDGSGLVYAIGGLGEDAELYSSAERYNPAKDIWAGIAPLPAPRFGATAVGVDSTYVYLFGGETSSGVQTTAYRYVIASNSWEVIEPMPVAVRSAVAVLNQNRIYVTGGAGTSGAVDTVQVYDLATGLWSLDTPLPAARYTHGAVLTPSGRILIAGGYDAANAASAAVFQTQQLNTPETIPVFNTSPVTAGSLDRPYSYDAGAVGNPLPVFSLITAPTGLTLDPASGLINWQPITGQVGVHSVTVRATNRVGFVDQTFNITVVSDTFAPTAPTDVQVNNVTSTSATLSWSGATDAVGVVYYGLYKQYRCGWRNKNRCYSLLQSFIPGETVTISELSPLSSHSYTIRAFDAEENQSGNSMLVSFTTLSPPTSFRYTGATTLPANFPLQLRLYANANPTATFSIVSGPQDLTLDTETGEVTWTPSAADVGTHTLVVRATNSGGTADLSADITVNPDAPQLSMQYLSGTALAGSPWSAQALDGSHTTSTYEIISSPAGMTIDPVTGILDWTPTPDNAGINSVIIRATNAASSADITFEFYVHFTGTVSNIQVTGLTDLYPTATWDAPVGTGADLTAGYTLVASVRYRYGRSWRTHRVTWETDGDTQTAMLNGLLAGRTYTLDVTPIDANDNQALTNSPGVAFQPLPGLPSVRWSISNTNGSSAIIAGQGAVIQFTENNPEFGAITYSILSAPTGFTINPVTGDASWTPTANDLGSIPVTIRLTNQIGSKDSTLSFYVYFSGSVQSAYATRDGNSAAAYWQPPIDNILPIANYRVTMRWQWSSRSRSRSMIVNGTSHSFGLIPTGAVWHKGVYITPLDANGNPGISTPLIPYNGALPAGLPVTESAWIEQVKVGADEIPMVEVQGEIGVSVAVEVSSDLKIWDPLDTVTITDEGVLQCPDTVSQGAQSTFYRLVTP